MPLRLAFGPVWPMLDKLLPIGATWLSIPIFPRKIAFLSCADTPYQQFKEAMSSLDVIEVKDWPGVESNEPALMKIESPDIE